MAKKKKAEPENTIKLPIIHKEFEITTDILNEFRPKSGKDSAIPNVRDFGAVGDGINDDTESITKAIEYCIPRGGMVEFPAGVYRITRPIEVLEVIEFQRQKETQ